MLNLKWLSLIEVVDLRKYYEEFVHIVATKDVTSHFCQVKGYITSRPKTLAGKGLYNLAKVLFDVKIIQLSL